MGTLTDITTMANNEPTQHVEATKTPPGPSLMKQDENLGSRKSPHFMSPTLSSTKQNAAKSSKAQDRTNSTPPSAAADKPQGNTWMASAAKHVGFRRMGDGTPRSRKEALKSKAVAFPDRVSTFTFYLGAWNVQ